MDTSLNGKTLAECKGFYIKAVRTSNGENQYKFIVINSERGNRDTAIVAWLSKSLSSKYNDGEFPHLEDCVLRLQEDDVTGEATHYLLTSRTLYVSIEDLLATQ